MTTLPSTAIHSPAVLARATCDGSGLITFRTEDGPEHAACFGCRSCTPAAIPVQRAPGRSVAAVFAAMVEDDL